MEVGPGNGERIVRAYRSKQRKQTVKDDYEDVPFCVSELCSRPFVSCH